MEHILLYNKGRKGVGIHNFFLPISRIATSLLVFAVFVYLASIAYSSSDAQEQLDFANGLFARQMYNMAISEYEKFITQYPENPDQAKASFFIAESYLCMKEYAKAIEKYNDYISKFSLDQNISRAHINSIFCNMELKDYEVAIQYASSLLKVDLSPDFKSETLYLLGNALLSSNNKQDALLRLREASGVNSGRYSAAASYKLGSLYWQDKDFQIAGQFFKKSADNADDAEVKQLSLLGFFESESRLGRYGEAVKGLSALVSDNSTNATVKERAVLGILNALSASERSQELISFYNDKKGIVVSSDLKFEATLAATRAYSKQGKYDDALSSLESLFTNENLASEQKDTLSLEKAAVLLLAGRVNESKGILDSSDKNTDMPRYLLLKAEASYYSKDFAGAVKHYEAILKNYPDSAQGRSASYGLAHALLKNGQKQEARGAFIMFYEKHPDDKQAAMALYSAAVLDRELGLKSEGVSDAKSFLERYPDHDKAKEVRFILGRLYSDLNDAESAIKILQEYEKLYLDDKRIPEVYYLLGHNFTKSGKLEEANSYYFKIIKQKEGGFYYSAQKNIVQNKLSQGKELEAAETIFALIKDSPENDLDVDTYIWTAKRFMDVSKFEAALELMNLAELKKEPINRKASIAYYKSEALRGLNKYDEAIAGYNNSIAEDKGSGEFSGPAYIGMGLCLKAKGSIDQAIKSFEDAIKFNPEDYTVAMNARYHIAELLMQQEKYEEAARMFMLVVVLYDDKHFVPESLHGAALAFHKAGKEEESKKAYYDILKKYPSFEKIDSLGKALEQE